MKAIKQTIIVSILFIQGCVLPYYPTERAAFVVVNELDSILEFKARLFDNWTPIESLPAQQGYHLYEYEQQNPKEPVPKAVQELEFTLEHCVIHLDSDAISEYSVKNNAGRPGWDLIVSEAFISQFGCDKDLPDE